MYNNDIFQCGGCEITRIRHTVSIMFSDQLRDRHVLWVDGEHNNLLFFVNVVLENGNGWLFMIE
ncbi:hypothetical protein COJ48_18880 [Bacillus cereus]|nr:hypothetical protein COJ48_18880 [Bacillus cereus]